MSNDYMPRKDEAFALPPVPQSFFDEFGVGADDKVMDYGHACRAPLAEENARLLARVAELEGAVEKEDEHDAPLPPEYKVEEFLPGIWAWSVKGESGWVGDGAAYGWYEAAVVAAWQDHADTLTSALDESTAAETSATEERDRLRADLAAKAGEIHSLRDCLAECLDDLSAEINARALGELPRRIERDLAPVRRAAALLAQPAGEWVNPLAAEVEKLRAASVIEWEPGRSYTAAELLRRAIRGLRVRKGRPVWPAVMNLFGVGSGVARYLCRWAGRDPDTGQEIAARKGEGVAGA